MPPLRIIANMIELGYAESDLYRVKYHGEYLKKTELTERSKFFCIIRNLNTEKEVLSCSVATYQTSPGGGS